MLNTVIINNKEFIAVMGCICIDGNWMSISETEEYCENMIKRGNDIHTTRLNSTDLEDLVKTVIADSTSEANVI